MLYLLSETTVFWFFRSCSPLARPAVQAGLANLNCDKSSTNLERILFSFGNPSPPSGSLLPLSLRTRISVHFWTKFVLKWQIQHFEFLLGIEINNKN
jgi:hypothetical protein